MMEIKTITFREIVKLIHPDINPDVKEPANKLQQIMVWRDNPRMLYRLAEEWDILTDDAEIQSYDSITWFSGKINITQDEPDVREEPVNQDESDVQEQPGDTEISVGDVISVSTKNGARFTVTKITAKRYYFNCDGKTSFCSKKNATKV
jgi:curved DNA-binding protein CbpA